VAAVNGIGDDLIENCSMTSHASRSASSDTKVAVIGDRRCVRVFGMRRQHGEDLRLYDRFERFRRLTLVTTSSGFNVPERRSEWPANKLTAYGEHDCARSAQPSLPQQNPRLTTSRLEGVTTQAVTRSR